MKRECSKKSREKWIKNNSEEHKKQCKRAKAKRMRNLKWIELWDNPFPEEIDVDYHHINNLFVLPIPSSLHENASGGKTNYHRNKMNKIIKEIYMMNIEKLLGE